MKLLLAFTLLLSTTVFGQGFNFEKSLSEYYDQDIKAMVCTGDYTYIATSNKISSSFFSPATVYKLDTNGTILWSRFVAPLGGERVDISNMIASENGGVYVVGYAMQTCDVMQNCYSFLEKIDAQGNSEWSREFFEYVCLHYDLTGISLNDQNDVYINYTDGSGSYSYALSPSGSQLDSTSVSVSHLQGYSFNSASHFMSFVFNHLYAFDASGMVINSQQFPNRIRGLKSKDDFVFVLTDDGIYKLSETLDSISFVSSGINMGNSSLKIDDNRLKFVGHNATKISLHDFDFNLSPYPTTTIQTGAINGDFIDYSETHIGIGDNFELSEHNAIRMIDYSLVSSGMANNLRDDIGVSAVMVESIQIAPYLDYDDVFKVDINPKIQLTNYGDSPINSCRVLGYQAAAICSQVYYNQLYDNLNLQAGESVWLDLGWLMPLIGSFPTDTVVHNLCFYTSTPDGLIDLNVYNDGHCYSLIEPLANLEEKFADQIRISPNPTSDYFEITSSSTSLNLHSSITTMNGELLLETTDISISLSNYPSGVYFLKVTDQFGRQVVKRVVKL